MSWALKGYNGNCFVSKHSRVFYSAKIGHRQSYSLAQLSHPLQSSRHQRHILVHCHSTFLVHAEHVLVVQLLGGTQLLVHQLDYFCVVVVEIVSYDRPLKKRTQDVNQLIEMQ